MSNAPGGLDMRPEWVVGFVEATGEASWWQRRLLRRGYAHCWAARPLCREGDGLWLWVEWVPDCVVLGVATTATVRAAAEGAHEALRWRQDLSAAGAPRRPLLAWHHCASLTAHTIGCRPRWLATPWWLRCALRRRGAAPFMPAPQTPEPHAP